MFGSTGFNTNPALTGPQLAGEAGQLPPAFRLFSEMTRAASSRCRLRSLCRRHDKAPAPVIQSRNSCVPNRRYAGLRSVPIAGIRRNEARRLDFDAAFHPLHARMLGRWLNVAARHLAGENLEAVSLLLSDGVYVVQDGHHRISVAVALGQAYVDAEVIEEIC